MSHNPMQPNPGTRSNPPAEDKLRGTNEVSCKPKTENWPEFTPNIAIGVALALVLLAMLGRFVSVDGLGNFNPVGAVALFAGCFLKNRKLALLVPITALVLSDIVLGWHALVPVVYACFALTLWFGTRLAEKLSPARVLGFALLSALNFFVVTNFAVWASSNMYPHTFAGLAQCFWLAVPFFRNDLCGTLIYSALLFGGYALYQARVRKFARS